LLEPSKNSENEAREGFKNLLQATQPFHKRNSSEHVSPSELRVNKQRAGLGHFVKNKQMVFNSTGSHIAPQINNSSSELGGGGPSDSQFRVAPYTTKNDSKL